jgi:hypothetical protein
VAAARSALVDDKEAKHKDRKEGRGIEGEQQVEVCRRLQCSKHCGGVVACGAS